MDNLEKAFGRFKWDIIIISVLTVALGVICVIMPETSGDVLSLIFGILMICVGLTLFVKYIVYGGFIFGGYILIPALSLLAFGIFCVTNPRLLQGMLTVLLGIYIVVDSSVAVSETVLCKRGRQRLVFAFCACRYKHGTRSGGNVFGIRYRSYICRRFAYYRGRAKHSYYRSFRQEDKRSEKTYCYRNEN